MSYQIKKIHTKPLQRQARFVEDNITYIYIYFFFIEK